MVVFLLKFSLRLISFLSLHKILLDNLFTWEQMWRIMNEFSKSTVMAAFLLGSYT